MATTTTTLPEPSLELDDDMLSDPADCPTCGLPHDDELHDAVLSIRSYRSEVTRRLAVAPAAKKFKPRPGKMRAVVLCGLQGICAHAGGWPLPRGGSQKIADALASYLRTLGSEIVTGTRVTSLPDAPLTLCDISPRALLSLAGARLPAGFRSSLEGFRYGPGVFKMDWALDGPIPWQAVECLRAGTVHLGGTLEEIAEWEGNYKGRPYVLVAQQSLFDETRAGSVRGLMLTFADFFGRRLKELLRTSI